MSDEKIKRNMLSRKDEFRLADWVRAKASQLNTMTGDEAAISAAKELGITITQMNVRRIAQDLGIKETFKITRTRGVPGEGVKARVARLEHLVAHLYVKLGETMPNS